MITTNPIPLTMDLAGLPGKTLSSLFEAAAKRRVPVEHLIAEAMNEKADRLIAQTAGTRSVGEEAA